MVSERVEAQEAKIALLEKELRRHDDYNELTALLNGLITNSVVSIEQTIDG
jgi:hypothetical protein